MSQDCAVSYSKLKRTWIWPLVGTRSRLARRRRIVKDSAVVIRIMVSTHGRDESRFQGFVFSECQWRSMREERAMAMRIAVSARDHNESGLQGFVILDCRSVLSRRKGEGGEHERGDGEKKVQ